MVITNIQEMKIQNIKNIPEGPTHCRAENSFPLGYRSRQIPMDIPSLFRGGGLSIVCLFYFLLNYSS